MKGDGVGRQAAALLENVKQHAGSRLLSGKFKPLTILLGAALLCTLTAYVMELREQAVFSPEEEAGIKLLTPQEQAALSSPARVTLTFAGRKLTLNKAGADGWVIAEKGNYPADPNAVRVLLAGLAQSTRAERKTDDPTRYGKLGLDPAGSVKVEIFGPSGGRELSLFFGTLLQGRGAYVRRDGEAEVWLAAGAPAVSADFTSWIQTKPFAAEEDAVTAVEARPMGSDEYRLERRGGQDGLATWAMEGVQEGYSVKDQTSLRSVASALSYLYIEDAAPAAAKKAMFDKGTAGATFYLKDGGIIMTEVAQAPASEEGKPGEVWVQFAAMPPPPEPSDPAAKDGKKNGPLLDYDYITRLTEGRVFRTPEFVAKDLSKTRGDLLQKLNAEAESAEQPAPAEAAAGTEQPAPAEAAAGTEGAPPAAGEQEPGAAPE